MIEFNEIREAMRGSWALARGQSEGLRHFGQSFDAFWRSFQVILYLVPVYLLLMVLPTTQNHSVAAAISFIFSNPLYYLGQAILVVLEWLAFPIIMIFISRILGVTARYSLFITVNNWSSLMIVGLLFPINLAWSLSVSNEPASIVFSILVLALVMRYRWFIAKTVLEVPSHTAIGLVVIEFLLSLIFTGIATRLLGAMP